MGKNPLENISLEESNKINNDLTYFMKEGFWPSNQTPDWVLEVAAYLSMPPDSKEIRLFAYDSIANAIKSALK